MGNIFEGFFKKDSEKNKVLENDYNNEKYILKVLINEDDEIKIKKVKIPKPKKI